MSADEKNYIALFNDLVDIVDKDGIPTFLVKNERNELGLFESVELDGKTYYPPEKEHMPFVLPRANEVIKHYQEQIHKEKVSNKKLYKELVSYLTDVSDLPDDNLYYMLAAWVIHTYLLDKFDYSPYINLHALPARGKTKTGRGLINISYRGLNIESVAVAHLFRYSENYEATLFLDAKDISGSAKKMGFEDILLKRFEKGAIVARINPDAGAFEDTRYYKIYGATVVATNEAIDDILSTRGITINMPESSKLFDRTPTPEEILHLKEKLTAFRARYQDKELPTVTKPCLGRLGDIIKPLLQIVRLVNAKEEIRILKLIENINNDNRTALSESEEACIFMTILKLKPFIRNGKLDNSKITASYNEGTPSYQRTSARHIADVTRAMGFKKGSSSNGGSAIYWDEVVIKSLCNRYGISYTPQPSVTSVSSASANSNSINLSTGRNNE